MLFGERISNNSAKRKESDVIEMVAKHALVETITTKNCEVVNTYLRHFPPKISVSNVKISVSNVQR